MERNKLIYMVILCALFLVVVATSISADESLPVMVENQLPQWDLPADLCSGRTQCAAPHVRINENNVLYTTSSDGLLAYYPDGSDPVSTSLPSSPPFGASGVSDYEPFGEDYILWFGFGSGPGLYHFFLYDLQTMDTTQIELPVGFEPCTSMMRPIDRSFYRLGSSQKVLACGTDSIHIIDISSQSLEESINFPNLTGGERSSRPYVMVGENEEIYLLFANGYSNAYLGELVPSFDYQIYPDTTLFVLHRPVGDTDWNVIVIPEDEFGTRAELDLADRSFSDIRIDQEGNLYFRNEWPRIIAGGTRIDLVKFNPQGERVWRITEEEMGDYTYLLDFLNDGSLLFWQDNMIEAQRIVALNADAGPDQTVVAQNGVSASVTLYDVPQNQENTMLPLNATERGAEEFPLCAAVILVHAVRRHAARL